jgi:hypothetical protein
MAKRKEKFAEVMRAFDGLVALEAAVSSIEEYRQMRLEKAADVERHEAVIAQAGKKCTSVAHMRNLYNLMVRRGFEYRSPVWVSVASSTMNRLWDGQKGWAA